MQKAKASALAFTLLSTALIIGASLFAHQQGLFAFSDRFIYDLRMQWRGPLEPSGDLTLVLLDAKSAKELKRQRGNWSRQHITQAISNLCQAEAEIIGLDMLFAAPVEPSTDNTLAQTIYDCNNVIMARVTAAGGSQGIEPLPLFQEAMIGDGFIDLAADKDEVVRRIRFLSAKPMEDGSIFLLPAFSLELARSFLIIEFEFDFSQQDAILMGLSGEKQVRLPYPELLINYFGTYQNFNQLSFSDVVHNRFDKEAVAGKVVLLGSSLESDKDFFTTPLSRFQQAESQHDDKFASVVETVDSRQDLGVSVHANALETILSQSYIQLLSNNWLILLACGMGILGILFYLPNLNLLLATSILLIGASGTLFASYYAFITELLIVDITPLLSVFMGQFVAGIAYQRRQARKRAAFIQGIFGNYVSPAVAAKMIKGDIELSLEGEHRELTMLFSDLRGFTSISEHMDARETGKLLNYYFNTMIPMIFKHRGTMDKLMGDAIMAFFGAPEQVDNHAVRAAEAALEMQATLADFRKSGWPNADKIHCGIGINTGMVTLGNLGSDRFMDYTVIGDAVNLGSRLEGLTGKYGVKIILSGFSVNQLDDRFLLRELDQVKVKGKADAVTIFELLGHKASATEEQLELVKLFEQALNCYRTRKWDDAQGLFNQVLTVALEDMPSTIYLQRIEEVRHADLPDDWCGVTVFDKK